MSRNPRDAKTDQLTKEWLRAELAAQLAVAAGRPAEEVEKARADQRLKKSTVLKHLRKVYPL